MFNYFSREANPRFGLSRRELKGEFILLFNNRRRKKMRSITPAEESFNCLELHTVNPSIKNRKLLIIAINY